MITDIINDITNDVINGIVNDIISDIINDTTTMSYGKNYLSKNYPCTTPPQKKKK